MPLSSRNVVPSGDSTNESANFQRTFAYTVGAGTELLLVGISELCNTDVFNVTGVTWDGAALTLVPSSKFRTVNEDSTAEWWSLVNPTAGGPANIVVTFVESAATAVLAATATVALEVIGGVDTADPFGTVDGAVGDVDTANAHKTIATANDNSLVLSFLGGRGGDTDPFAPQAGITTELVDAATGELTANDIGYWLGEALTTTAGNYDVGATMSVADRFALSAVEVKAAAAAGANIPAMMHSYRQRRAA